MARTHNRRASAACRFRGGADLIWSTPQSRLHLLQIEQVVGPTSHYRAQLSREDIKEGSRIAIQAVQSHEDGSWRKPQVYCIAGKDPDRSSQFPTVIAVAGAAKRAEELMRIRLKNDRTRANHFSSLPPLISRRAHL